MARDAADASTAPVLKGVTLPLGEAWAALDAATPPGWYVGRPNKHDEMTGAQWEQFAFDPSERPKAGKRSREWIAIAPTEIGVVLAIAEALREFRAGRVPK